MKNKKIKVLLVAVVIAGLVLLVKQLLAQKFTSVEELQSYVKEFGFAAPLVLTAFQALQVVVPVVPGYLGCAAGAIAFGSTAGFLCNYIGITVGSILAYFLAKKFGIDLVLSLFPERQYEKWKTKVKQSKSYERLLFVATLLPLFPDDFLCYFSGLMKMDKRKFIWIIVLGKPWCILAYSIAFGFIR